MTEDRFRGVIANQTPAIGDAAPDFELPALVAGVKQPLRLSAYRGEKNVVLAFYPFNWQETTATQLISYQVQRPRVLANKAEVVAITVDSIMNTTAWERAIGPFDFPLCSDFWPHGEVSKRYGVLRKSGGKFDDGAGSSDRVVLVVDRSGTITFRKTYAREQVPPVEEVLSALEQI